MKHCMPISKDASGSSNFLPRNLKSVAMGKGGRQAVGPLGRGMVAAVRVAMARRNMDQATLAARSGMSAAYLSRRLSAQYVLTLHDVERLADALGMTPERLVTEAVAEAAMMDDGDSPQESQTTPYWPDLRPIAGADGWPEAPVVRAKTSSCPVLTMPR